MGPVSTCIQFTNHVCMFDSLYGSLNRDLVFMTLVSSMLKNRIPYPMTFPAITTNRDDVNIEYNEYAKY